MRCAFFRHLRDPRPVLRDLQWQRLAHRLQQTAQASSKHQIPCWSPAGYPAGTLRRSLASVEVVSALVLDYDQQMPLAEAADRWQGWQGVAHTTYSHSEAEPRCRVVLPLLVPIAAAVWSAVYRACVAQDGDRADPSCSDPSRIYLLPGSPDPTTATSVQLEGQRLDLSELAARVRQRLAQQQRQRQQRRRPVWQDSARGRDRARRQAMAEDPEVRHRLALAWGARVHQRGTARVATGLQCPGCDRHSVWYVIDCQTRTTARCNHADSCGWYGPLWALNE